VRKIVAVVLLICVITSLVAFPALALPPAPSAWEVVFEDYNRIFYMTPTSDTASQMCMERLIEEHGKERMWICSGLYYNTTPLVNIYYVDELYFRLFFSNCGIYFANIRGIFHPLNRPNELDRAVVSFFRYGSYVRSYSANYLLRNFDWMDPPRTGEWPVMRVLEHNMSENTLSIVTMDDRAFTFDITTGEIISSPRNMPLLPIIIATMTAALLAVIIIIIYKRKSNRKDDAV